MSFQRGGPRGAGTAGVFDARAKAFLRGPHHVRDPFPELIHNSVQNRGAFLRAKFSHLCCNARGDSAIDTRTHLEVNNPPETVQIELSSLRNGRGKDRKDSLELQLTPGSVEQKRIREGCGLYWDGRESVNSTLGRE